MHSSLGNSENSIYPLGRCLSQSRSSWCPCSYRKDMVRTPAINSCYTFFVGVDKQVKVITVISYQSKQEVSFNKALSDGFQIFSHKRLEVDVCSGQWLSSQSMPMLLQCIHERTVQVLGCEWGRHGWRFLTYFLDNLIWHVERVGWRGGQFWPTYFFSVTDYATGATG